MITQGEFYHYMVKELLECLSHIEKWLPHATQYGLIDGECMHSLYHFRTKLGIVSQCEISPVGFITCNAIYLCWLQKEGQIILWWINSCCSFLMLYNGSHTLTWRVILLHNERTTVGSSYLTLKIDSYTTWNMISPIVNVHICFTILLAKRQSSVNTVYLKKYIVGSPLIMWLDDYGCICTYYLMALLNLRKGSYFIISGNNSQSVYRTLQNESHTLMGELFFDVQEQSVTA